MVFNFHRIPESNSFGKKQNLSRSPRFYEDERGEKPLRAFGRDAGPIGLIYFLEGMDRVAESHRVDRKMLGHASFLGRGMNFSSCDRAIGIDTRQRVPSTLLHPLLLLFLLLKQIGSTP